MRMYTAISLLALNVTDTQIPYVMQVNGEYRHLAHLWPV